MSLSEKRVSDEEFLEAKLEELKERWWADASRRGSGFAGEPFSARLLVEARSSEEVSSRLDSSPEAGGPRMGTVRARWGAALSKARSTLGAAEVPAAEGAPSEGVRDRPAPSVRRLAA